MSDLNLMHVHKLDAIKGWWDEHALDKAAPVDLGEGEVAYEGMVACLNADAHFQLGLECAAMPIFLHQGSGDYDVQGSTGNMVGAGGVAVMSGLVATGPYELQSTEYDSDNDELFVPNTPLTSPAPGAANAGRIEVGAFYTDTVCGVVSDGVITNENGVKVVTFWSYFLPAQDCGSSSER